MQVPARGRLPLLRALERLAPHEHLCLLYGSRKEQFAAAIPFLRMGLERGERCIYVADDNTVAAVLAGMQVAGIDTDAALRTGALTVATQQEAYLRDGRFDPDAMIRFLEETTDAAIAAGFTALRVTGEMTWALGDAPGAGRLIEYESKLAPFFDRKPCVALCQYNTRRFPPEVILGVIRTHPMVIWDGAVCRNLYYAPPREFLKPAQQAHEVARLLRSIRSRQETEEALRESVADLERSRGRLRALIARLVTRQEEEQERVSWKLRGDWDRIAGLLASRLEALQQRLPAPAGRARRELKALKNRVLEFSDDLRRTAQQFQPAIPERQGLATELKSYCVQFSQRNPVRVSFRAQDLRAALPRHVTASLYHVAQEALENVARHSGAGRASVTLRQNGRDVCLCVTDRGAGFDPEAAQAQGSLGLLSMEERLRRAGGVLRIQSRPGKGTRLEACLPLAGPTARRRRRPVCENS